MLPELITSSNIATALVFVVFFLLVWTLTYRPPGIAPGPPRMPVMGSLLSIYGKDVRHVFQDFRRQYGDVFSVYLGNQLVIVINGFDSIKNAFVKRGDDFSSRPHNFFTVDLNDNMGIINLSSRDSRGQRKFILGVLREFGVGKHSLEFKIQDEIRHYLTELENKKGEPFDIKQSLLYSVSNVISAIAWGNRHVNDDPLFQMVVDNAEIAKNLITKATIAISICPFLKWLPGDWLGINTMKTIRDYFHTYATKVIAEHQENFDEDCIRDVLDAYLLEMKKSKTSHQDTIFKEKQIIGVVGDLFGAGTETINTTIRWALIYMVRQPDVQLRLQAEIDEVVGRNRLPKQEDRPQLPYTEAFIMEVQRISDVTPFSIPYGMEKDVNFHGYTFPKGATVLMNISSVLLDSNLWENPNDFMPERFLTEQMEVKRPEEFIPFSVGRRICVGEALAKMELYLYLAAMIQRFSFLPPDGEGPPSLEGDFEITRTPKSFRIRAVPRF